MTDRKELEDRLGAVEEDLADTSDLPPMFVTPPADGYVTPDGEPAPEGSGALFALPPEVTDNWGRAGDGRGDT